MAMVVSPFSSDLLFILVRYLLAYEKTNNNPIHYNIIYYVYNTYNNHQIHIEEIYPLQIKLNTNVFKQMRTLHVKTFFLKAHFYLSKLQFIYCTYTI